MVSARITILAASAAVLAGCTTHSPVRALEPRVAFVTSAPNGVEHVVYLAPSRPAPEDTLYIRSVIRNASSEIAVVTASHDLGTGGTLELRMPLDLARFRSGRTYQLAPRDSVVKVEARIVASPPGRYGLSVRHAEAPPIAAAGEVVVVPPSVH